MRNPTPLQHFFIHFVYNFSKFMKLYWLVNIFLIIVKAWLKDMFSSK